MSLYDSAVNLALKLDAAVAADASDHLLAQGQMLVLDLDRASATLEAAADMRAALGAATDPTVDTKSVNQAIGAFRAGLSCHGASAFQHTPASTLREVAKQQRLAAERWALHAWRSTVDRLAPHAADVTSDRLHGTTGQRLRAQNRLRLLSKVRDLNPLTEATKLQAELGGSSLNDWIAAVAALDVELQIALEQLDATRARYSPVVKAALVRADSDTGLRLDELTDELLVELRTAGVDDQLVVRRL